MSQNVKFPKDIVKKVRCGQPIEAYGLILYPIMMEDYEEFLMCKDALAIMQGSLPAKYLSMDFLSALFQMSVDESQSDAPPDEKTAAFQRVIRLFYMALRLSDDEIERVAQNIVYKQNSQGNLAIERIMIYQNGNVAEITPVTFSRKIRPLIAYQNAIELPDESTNPELIRFRAKIHEHDESVKLKANTDDLIASVAFQSATTTRSLMEWTVREFEYRVKAIDRDKRYTLCGQAEMSGFASFKDGNPAPSWQYDVDIDMPDTTSLSEVGKKLQGAGVKQK